MEVLNSCLSYYKPAHWDEKSYSNNRYFRIELEKHNVEYKTVEKSFLEVYGTYSVRKIERIQHPFAYMRFQIRKEQLTVINRYQPTTSRKFFAVTDTDKIDKIIEFNCDHRHGGIQVHQYQRYLNDNDGYVIAIEVLDNSYDTRDSHRYPEYLIQYSCHIDNNTDRLSSGFKALDI